MNIQAAAQPRTFSYASVIMVNGRPLTYNRTTSFIQNGRTYSGVFTLGTGTELTINQNFNEILSHSVVVCSTNYLTYALNNEFLPADVKMLLGNTPPGAFFITTTSSLNTNVYLTQSYTSNQPTASTVDLTVSTSFCLNFANSIYWMINNQVSSTQASPSTVVAPTPAQSSGGSVDPEGNPVLQNGEVVSFTATVTGPVLGAFDTGVAVPATTRNNSIMVAQGSGGGIARWMPYQPTPDITLSGLSGFADVTNAPNRITPPNSSSTNLVLIDDSCKYTFLQTLSGGASHLYIYDFPNLLQTISFNTQFLTSGIAISTDGSIIAINQMDTNNNANLLIYTLQDDVWVLANTITAYKSATSSDNYGQTGYLRLSKDGCVLVAGSGTRVDVFETDATAEWTAVTTTNLLQGGVPTNFGGCSITANGQYIYITQHNTILAYKRAELGDWEQLIVGPITGITSSFYLTNMAISYDGVMLIANSTAHTPFFIEKYNDNEFVSLQTIVLPANANRISFNSQFTNGIITTASGPVSACRSNNQIIVGDLPGSYTANACHVPDNNELCIFGIIDNSLGTYGLALYQYQSVAAYASNLILAPNNPNIAPLTSFVIVPPANIQITVGGAVESGVTFGAGSFVSIFRIQNQVTINAYLSNVTFTTLIPDNALGLALTNIGGFDTSGPATSTSSLQMLGPLMGAFSGASLALSSLTQSGLFITPGNTTVQTGAVNGFAFYFYYSITTGAYAHVYLGDRVTNYALSFTATYSTATPGDLL